MTAGTWGARWQGVRPRRGRIVQRCVTSMKARYSLALFEDLHFGTLIPRVRIRSPGAIRGVSPPGTNACACMIVIVSGLLKLTPMVRRPAFPGSTRVYWGSLVLKTALVANGFQATSFKELRGERVARATTTGLFSHQDVERKERQGASSVRSSAKYKKPRPL